MLSVPPATMMSVSPSFMDCAARMMAFMPEAQTLLTVVQTVVLGRPAPRETCRAGFWPKLALRTQPKKTSSTADAGTPDRLMAAT